MTFNARLQFNLTFDIEKVLFSKYFDQMSLLFSLFFGGGGGGGRIKQRKKIFRVLAT